MYQPGDTIVGKYELDVLLGEGGMGTVWRARHVALDSNVALKLIRSDVALEDGADRLLREAQAAAKLVDPAIVRVFDFGRSEHGDPFIVMELLSGEDLSSAIASRGRLSAKRAVRVLLPVVRALALAHAQGVVHRDLKPENIFLARLPEGLQPKVVDFGIALVDQKASLRLTSTGAVVGSPLYMSPEQAKGQPVDFRADIWSLCVVLYELITGSVPFPGTSYNAVLHAVISAEPVRPTSDQDIDAELWAILSRGFAKEPAYRFESMRELGRALAGWLSSKGEHDDITGASLTAQWLEKNSQVDQLITMFPPEGSLPSDTSRSNPTERVATSWVRSALERIQSAPSDAVSGIRRPRLLLGVLVAATLGAFALGIWLSTSERPAASSEPAVSAEQAPTQAKAATEPPPAPRPEATSAAPEPVSSKQAAAAPKPRATKRTTPRSVRSPRPVSRAAKLKNPFAR